MMRFCYRTCFTAKRKLLTLSVIKYSGQISFKKYFAACFPTRYTFYDGPPFATGLPHYGHILAGTIKDIVTRFAHQSGFHVDRRFGWDCHGLPVVRFYLHEYS